MTEAVSCYGIEKREGQTPFPLSDFAWNYHKRLRYYFNPRSPGIAGETILLSINSRRQEQNIITYAQCQAC